MLTVFLSHTKPYSYVYRLSRYISFFIFICLIEYLLNHTIEGESREEKGLREL